MVKAIAAFLSVAAACDVSYDFGDLSNAVATKMEATLTWYQVENLDHADIYMATATGTACNSGYFGAQFHRGGKTTLLFSMWDAPRFEENPEFVFQSLPGSPTCNRNALDTSGKSTGTQCSPELAGEEVHLEIGVPYTFSFGVVRQNASGAMWEATMFDPKRTATISIGKIFFVDAPMGLPTTCRTLGRSQNPPVSGLAAYSFMENFAQHRDYLSVGSWSDMKISASWHAGFLGRGCELRQVGRRRLRSTKPATIRKVPGCRLRRRLQGDVHPGCILRSVRLLQRFELPGQLQHLAKRPGV